MRNFKRDGGGSIRMYGLLNALADDGNEVIFISNAENYVKFHPNIKHIYINFDFKDKARFQGLAAILPAKIVLKIYFNLFSKIEIALKCANLKNDESEKVIFCEYLDNSIAYILKKTGAIKSYINDLHGIATIEFKYQSDQQKNLFLKGLFFLKYLLSDALDRKVFGYGDGFIYASKSMKQFYEERYKKTINKKKFILPYFLSKNSCKNVPDKILQIKLRKQLDLNSNDFVFFFAGGYKPTAGVEDLICAFSKLSAINSNVKLILIGAGGNYNNCRSLVKKLTIENVVVFIEKVPYEELITYQSLADVIVCPDRFNPYSELIVHLKYFDSLISNKIVINSSFKSVKEINVDDFLSLSFEPSNQQSLFETMLHCNKHYDTLKEKYVGTKEFACSHLTYSDVIKQLYN
jgi:glycosyltransferase involved in cell wall biosynthesis